MSPILQTRELCDELGSDVPHLLASRAHVVGNCTSLLMGNMGAMTGSEPDGNDVPKGWSWRGSLQLSKVGVSWVSCFCFVESMHYKKCSI